jgi:hypothetical protein
MEVPSVLEEGGPPMGQPSAEYGEDSSENENEGTQNENEGTGTNKLDDNKKKEEQFKFIEDTTLDDVLVDASNPIKVGRQSNDVTFLQSIKGVVQQISGYKNKPKTFLCNLVDARDPRKTFFFRHHTVGTNKELKTVQTPTPTRPIRRCLDSHSFCLLMTESQFRLQSGRSL